jgi:DeoR/GlpR family transcriptional regulator of sugar metabolism
MVGSAPATWPANHVSAGFFLILRRDVAFLGSGGLDAARRLTDYCLDEAETRRVVLEYAGSSVLAGSSTFGVVATR